MRSNLMIIMFHPPRSILRASFVACHNPPQFQVIGVLRGMPIPKPALLGDAVHVLLKFYAIIEDLCQ